MAAVVGVHGIAQQYKGPSELAAAWLPSLQDGVHFAGSELRADFAMAFYGNMFRGNGTMAGGFPPLTVADLDDSDAELLELWWAEASRIDPAVPGPAAATMIRTPRVAQRALNALSQSRFFSGMAERAMIGAVKQVRLYFCDSQVREHAIRAVKDVVTADTRVIVAHSLGSVVAYEALAVHPEWNVRVLVTVGSPLGISNLVFDRLSPSPVEGRGVWPGSVAEWVNVASPGDVVALVKNLRDRFDGNINDHLVDNGAKAHDATVYLTTEQVGAAVRRGLE